jgi:hypothetical protein
LVFSQGFFLVVQNDMGYLGIAQMGEARLGLVLGGFISLFRAWRYGIAAVLV